MTPRFALLLPSAACLTLSACGSAHMAETTDASAAPDAAFAAPDAVVLVADAGMPYIDDAAVVVADDAAVVPDDAAYYDAADDAFVYVRG